jgi:hypothetical protein
VGSRRSPLNLLQGEVRLHHMRSTSQQYGGRINEFLRDLFYGEAGGSGAAERRRRRGLEDRTNLVGQKVEANHGNCKQNRFIRPTRIFAGCPPNIIKKYKSDVCRLKALRELIEMTVD